MIKILDETTKMIYCLSCDLFFIGAFMVEVNDDNYFDAAQGLHWYCVDFHGGQFSNLYLIQCKLGYNPGILERGCDNDEYALYFYQALEYGEIQPFELLEKIQDVLRSLD